MNGRYGTWLRMRRLERHMTQQTLADQARLDRSYLARIERGRIFPGNEIRDRLNCALKISPTDHGYIRALPAHERSLAQLSAQESALTPGQSIDRMLLFASAHEFEMITAFIHLLEQILLSDDDEGSL